MDYEPMFVFTSKRQQMCVSSEATYQLLVSTAKRSPNARLPKPT